MRESQAIIERISRLSRSLVRLDLAVEPALSEIEAGQYLLARPQTGWEPYLRAAWFPVWVGDGQLTVECPPSAVYTPGRPVSIIGPAGRPVKFGADVHHLLLVAHDHDPTPLQLFAARALDDELAVTLVMGGKTDYPMDALPTEIEVIEESGWKWPDKVAAIRWADMIVAVAPWMEYGEYYADLADTVRQVRNELPRGFLFGMFTYPLVCGVGACGMCLVAGRKRDLVACTDGPALDLSEVRL